MGSRGRVRGEEPTRSTRTDETFYDFSDNPALYSKGYWDEAKRWWREHDEYSNTAEWEDALTPEERSAIHRWIGSGYEAAAKLYKTPWDDLTDDNRRFITNLYNAINKFELKKGITVNRRTNFKIFGSDTPLGVNQVVDYIKNNTIDGHIQIDGHMSFSTLSKGVSVDGTGLVIHMNVPPSKGAGAYVSTVGYNTDEKEFLTNNNAILRFDPNSVERRDDGMIHVNARYVGRAQMQTIDPKNTSRYKKST